jgi:hypothetical protein
MLLTDTHLMDAYTGRGGFETGAYLVRHGRESDEKYANRQAICTYPNYVRKVLNAYLGTLFGAPAQRSGAAPAWAALQANADGTGGQIDDVMRRAERLAMLLGSVYLVVDRPQGRAVTRADDRALMPYVVVRKPADVADLRLSRLGGVERVVFRDRDAAGEPVFRGWDAQRWWISTDEGGESLVTGADDRPASGEHGLGRVPVVRLHSSDPLEVTDARADPWVRDLAALAMDLFNLWSELRELLRSQTFSIFTLPIADAAEVERLRTHGLTIGTENAVPYDPSRGGAPGYVAPPDGPVTLYQQQIKDTVARIYELANLEFIGSSQASGVALEYHTRNANKTLGLFAQGLELAEMEVGRLACAWMGEDAADLRSTYPKSFDVEDLRLRLGEAMDAVALDMGAEFNRLLKARTARQVLGDAVGPTDYEAIDRELAAQGDPYGDRAAAEMGAGTGAGVGAMTTEDAV